MRALLFTHKANVSNVLVFDQGVKQTVDNPLFFIYKMSHLTRLYGIDKSTALITEFRLFFSATYKKLLLL
uniref:Uncharacterized protein n=1 Tax=Anguilla anguilla TaxID=7936 RepID=A0A0E9S6A9_ANGAN